MKCQKCKLCFFKPHSVCPDCNPAMNKRLWGRDAIYCKISKQNCDNCTLFRDYDYHPSYLGSRQCKVPEFIKYTQVPFPKFKWKELLREFYIL